MTEPADDLKARGTIAQVDLTTTKLDHRYRVGIIPAGVAVGEGAVWVGNLGDGTVSRINLSDGSVQPIRVSSTPVNLTTGYGSVWVIGGDAGQTDKTVWKLNPSTRQADAIIHLGTTLFAIATGAGAVWTANPEAGTVIRIDPRTNQIVKTVRLGFNPQGIAVADDAVWVTVGNEGGVPFPF